MTEDSAVQEPEEAPVGEDAAPSPQPEAPRSLLHTVAALYQVPPRAIMWILVVISTLVCFGVVKAVQASRRSAAQTRAEMVSWRLFRSKSPQQLDDLVARFPESELVPVAILKRAQAKFYEGKLKDAFEDYDKFVKTHADHRLLYAALLGRITCLEATGNKEQLEGALREYTVFASRPAPPGPTPEQQAEQVMVRDLLASEAQFGRGRCLEQLGRLEEAKEVYSQLAIAKSEVWIDRAEQAVERIDDELKRKSGTL